MWYHGKYATDKAIVAKLAWYDGDATGGTHETATGPTRTYTLPARSYLRMTAQAPPDASNGDTSNHDRANQVRLYASDDGSSTWHLTTYTAEPWASSVASLASVGSGTPGAGTPFGTAATPGVLRSAAVDSGIDGITELVSLKGNGAFRLGNYTSVRHFGTRTHSGDTTISSGSVTQLAFNTAKEAVTGLSWDSGNNRFVIAKPGVYLVVFSVKWENTGTSARRMVQIAKNGTSYALNEVAGATFSSSLPSQEVTAMIPCDVGDTIQANVFQNSGGNVKVVGGDDTRLFFSCGFVSQ